MRINTLSIKNLFATDKNLKHVIFVWIIFSLCYWFAAFYKPFHVDEFFSWVYAEKSTFAEIIRLKDFGIGHPPLFHLIQKTVQTIFPKYFPIQVRLFNYIPGSIYVILLTSFLLKKKQTPLVCYGVCLSATVIDAFIFGRMWGLVSMFSVIFFILGERYCGRPRGRILMQMTAVYILGLFADYNFIILSPYFLFVVFSHRPFAQKLRRILFIVLGAGWLLAELIFWVRHGTSPVKYFFALFHSLAKIGNAVGDLLFNFGFKELFLLACLAVSPFLLAEIISSRKQGIVARRFFSGGGGGAHASNPCSVGVGTIF